MTNTYWAAHALLPAGPARDVRFEVRDGRFAAVVPDMPPGEATRLPGVVLPGFANCHSHAFHRALRGRTQDHGGTFWTWRTRMYELAQRLDPGRYLALARATYAELACAGAVAVGEFHYLHHAPGGRRYAEPNAMAEALRQAASEAGVRLTLLDACYLTGGLAAAGHRPLDGAQRRFADPNVESWAERSSALREDVNTRIGIAIHSVRAVPPAALPTVVQAAAGRPLHVHLSEQPAENAACLAHYGKTPAALLDEAGALTATTSVVHATHVTAEDVGRLARSATSVCFCPTTERDLGDGIGPAGELADAGVPISLGTDQHAHVDLFEEARELELHERLRTGQRGRFTPGQLLDSLTRHRSLGWPDAGQLAVGQRADLVAVRLDTPRTAGCEPQQVVFAATSADVHTVVVDGRPIVIDGAHVLGDVGTLLADAIDGAWLAPNEEPT